MRTMFIFDRLEEWQRLSRKSDAALGELIGVSRWKIMRAKRGVHVLPMADQLALERITGITPSEWAEFYADCERKRSAEKKSLVEVA